MNERVFSGAIEKLRNPERLARLQIDRVMAYTLAGQNARTAIDVGTGTGVFAEALYQRGLQVKGIDSNSEFVGLVARMFPEIEFFTAPAESLPFADQSADLVFMGHMLHEANDAAAAVREAFRVTRHRLAVLEWPCIDQPVGPPLNHRIPIETIRLLGEQAGFVCCDVIQLQFMLLVILDR